MKTLNLCIPVMRTPTWLVHLFQPIAVGICVSLIYSSKFVRLQVILGTSVLGIIVSLLEGESFPVCFPMCNPTIKTITFIGNGNNIYIFLAKYKPTQIKYGAFMYSSSSLQSFNFLLFSPSKHIPKENFNYLA